MWPTSFALKELTATEEARIGALVKRAAELSQLPSPSPRPVATTAKENRTHRPEPSDRRADTDGGAGAAFAPFGKPR